jgi:predicted ferric reductase
MGRGRTRPEPMVDSFADLRETYDGDPFAERGRHLVDAAPYLDDDPYPSGPYATTGATRTAARPAATTHNGYAAAADLDTRVPYPAAADLDTRVPYARPVSPAVGPAGAAPDPRDPVREPTGSATRYQPSHTLSGPVTATRSRREYVAPDGERISRTGRRLVRALFWVALVLSVGVWWTHTPAGSVTGTAGVLIAAGRITGMVSGFVLLVQILTMSRVAWLETWIGAHDLLIWHRELGGFLPVVVLAHMFLLIFGYAFSAGTSPLAETWTILTTMPAMISAFVATGILVALCVLAIRRIRRRMSYELWYLIHLATYLVLLWSYGHQFAAGAELVEPGFARWYWLSLYVFVLVCLVWGRVLEPAWLNARHRLRVVKVVHESGDMVSVYIGGHALDRLDARAGQYFRWRFLCRGMWWQAHPFSLSAAPNAEWLRITVKVVGDHTEDLRNVRPGVRVYAEGPSGQFTAAHRRRHRALLIAGGSGIAPIRALLESLPAGTVVLYRASRAEDILFREELDWLARERGAQIWYVLGSREDPWPRRVFTPRGMRELVPDVQRRDVYMCGPDGLVSTSLKTLRKLHVPQKQIHLDPFEF